MSVTIDSVLVRDASLSTADVDGRLVVLSLDRGSYIDLNEVASEIWQMLSAPCRVSQIFNALSQNHDVDIGILSRDVMPFLQDLIDRRLARQIETSR